MKHILIVFSLLASGAAFADTHLYLPIDGLKTPEKVSQIRLYGGHTKALHDLLPMDPDTDGTKLSLITEQGPLTVISCVREYSHPASDKTMDNYLCAITYGPETAVHEYWPLQPLDMGGPYAGPAPIAGVMGLDPGGFPEDGEIVFWGKQTALFAESLPSPVTFEGPYWKLILGCQRDYLDPKTKIRRHDYLCKLILKGR